MGLSYEIMSELTNEMYVLFYGQRKGHTMISDLVKLLWLSKQNHGISSTKHILNQPATIGLKHEPLFALLNGKMSDEECLLLIKIFHEDFGATLRDNYYQVCLIRKKQKTSKYILEKLVEQKLSKKK